MRSRRNIIRGGFRPECAHRSPRFLTPTYRPGLLQNSKIYQPGDVYYVEGSSELTPNPQASRRDDFPISNIHVVLSQRYLFIATYPTDHIFPFLPSLYAAL